ncbi:MAG: hypothetical protein Q7S96_03655 [bacterium]|nr:hypothetical protein [bacterium]
MLGWLPAFNFASPTWDLFIILFFIVFSLLYGVSLGRDRILAIIVAIYMALAVVYTVPWFHEMSGTTVQLEVGSSFVFRVTVFLGVLLFIFFLLSRSAMSWAVGGTDGPFVQTFLFSILHVGLLVSVTLSFLPAVITQQFAPITRTVFLTDIARSCWIILPILTMVLAKRPREERY